MTQDIRETLKLALEAFEFIPESGSMLGANAEAKRLEAITAIKEALAQPEQEPVAIVHRNEYNEYRLEPHDNFDIKSIPFNIDVPLFKSPQRTWQGLTEEDKKQMFKEANYHWEMTAGEYAERIGQLTEAKLKEKNT